MKASNRAITKLKEKRAALHAMKVQPTRAVAQANVATLKEVLHMSNKQVRRRVCACSSRAPAHFTRSSTHCI